jgi:uncharacterized protein (DUF2267 family)
MQYEMFVQELRQRTGLGSNSHAIDAARAVLETIFECLPGAMASEVAAHLPGSLRADLRRLEFTPGEMMTVSEFLKRIARREGVSEPDAFCHAQAVLQMLAGSLGYDLVERVRAELPREFDRFWGMAPALANMHQPVA